MNLPNRLTVGRLFLTIFFVTALSASFRYQYTLSLALFVLAAATDYIDGEIARRYSLVTDFGKLMDPLVDKIMTTAAFVCLVPLRAIPAWVAIVVITREFLITGLRLLAVSQGRILAAAPIGKDELADRHGGFFPRALDLAGMAHCTNRRGGGTGGQTVVLRWLGGQRDRGSADDLLRAGLSLATPRDVEDGMNSPSG